MAREYPRKVRDYTRPDLQIDLERKKQWPTKWHTCKNKYAEIKGFIGGNIKNEARYCYYETGFINVHISC